MNEIFIMSVQILNLVLTGFLILFVVRIYKKLGK